MKLQTPTIGGNERALPCYFRGESSNQPARSFLPLSKCRGLKAAGFGDFINRGKAFRRFDRSGPEPDVRIPGTGAHTNSLKVDEKLMNRYVDATTFQAAQRQDRHAIAAIRGWRGRRHRDKFSSANEESSVRKGGRGESPEPLSREQDVPNHTTSNDPHPALVQCSASSFTESNPSR